MSSILKISDAASIALHAMIMLAEKENKLLSVRDIATKLDISANHLSKVMQRLVKAELVESVKGSGGGFKLYKTPAEVTFFEVYEAIDGKFKPSSCLLNKSLCQHHCIMGGLVSSINNQVETFFKKTKLTDFIK